MFSPQLLVPEKETACVQYQPHNCTDHPWLACANIRNTKQRCIRHGYVRSCAAICETKYDNDSSVGCGPIGKEIDYHETKIKKNCASLNLSLHNISVNFHDFLAVKQIGNIHHC